MSAAKCFPRDLNESRSFLRLVCLKFSLGLRVVMPHSPKRNMKNLLAVCPLRFFYSKSRLFLCQKWCWESIGISGLSDTEIQCYRRREIIYTSDLDFFFSPF